MDRTKNLEEFDVQRTFERLAAEGAMRRASHVDRRLRWRRFNIQWFVLIALPLLTLLILARISVVRTPYSFIACGINESFDDVFPIAHIFFE